MSRLLTFNPYNDLALASGVRRYTPPKAGLLLAQSAWPLLRYIAESDDVVWDGISPLDSLNVDKVEPWGWSAAECHRLRDAGCPRHLLPCDDRMEQHRLLSHRRTSIAVNRWLGSGLEASEITDVAEITAGGGVYVVKSPWSSSGRGVLMDRNADMAGLRRHAQGIIRRQGSVMLERRLDKIADFAMLYRLQSGKAVYHGLSVFESTVSGTYTGNVIAPQSALAGKLESQYGHSFVDTLSRRVGRALEAVIGEKYEGWAGVDMLIYRNDDGEAEIAPCIEVNLRCTMGVVALGVASRTKCKGIMHVLPGTFPVPDGAVHLVEPGNGFNVYLTPMPLDFSL